MFNKKTILIGLSALLILGGGTLYMARNFISDASVEKVPQDSTSQSTSTTPPKKSDIMATGNFIEIDKVHKGTGTATIAMKESANLLHFGSDFVVTSGPDLVVYLSKNNVHDGEEIGDIVSLGKLKSTTGQQSYNLPENIADFKSVVIWCRAFGVLFSAAPIEI